MWYGGSHGRSLKIILSSRGVELFRGAIQESL